MPRGTHSPDVSDRPSMTTTYDPKHPKYLDEADVRDELTRVYDLCHGCRLCFKFCTSFPTLFEMIDRHDDQDAGRLTPAQQDQVVDECFQCKLCYVNCPYTPGSTSGRIDFPRLMLRADAMRHANGQVSVRARLTDTGAGPHRPARQGWPRVAAPLANTVIGAKPGSLVRKVDGEGRPASRSERLLPPYARQRFTPGSSARPRVRIAKRQGRVAVFPTCLVEYQQPGDRPRPRQGLRAQRHRVLARRRRRLLRRAVAAQRRRRAVHQGRREERARRWPTAVRARQRHRRAPADVRLRAQEGLRRLRRRRRRPAGRRPHLRRGRVPHEGAQGRGHDARHRLRRRRARRPSPTTRPATCGPRTSG